MTALERWLPRLAAVLLLVLLGVSGQRAWQGLQAPSPETVEGPEVEATRHAPAAAPPDPARVAQMDLFGRPGSTPEPVRAAAVEAPKTRLNLTLHGVLASSDTESARAIISAADGEDKHYVIGETLPGGAEIAEVHPDRVVLRREGRFETLPLVREGLDREIPGAEAGLPQPPRAVVRSPVPRPVRPRLPRGQED